MIQNDDRPSVLVCFPRLWAYVPIPKVACTSIQRAIDSYAGLEPSPSVHGRAWPKGCGVEAMTLSEWCLVRKDIPNDSFTSFAFVREPLDRLISVWAEKCVEPAKDGLATQFMPFVGRPFGEFAYSMCQDILRGSALDKHIAPQSAFLVCNGHVVVDFVYSFTSLETVWKGFEVDFGLPLLPMENVSSKRRKKRAAADCELEIVRLVREAYAEDYDRWF